MFEWHEFLLLKNKYLMSNENSRNAFYLEQPHLYGGRRNLKKKLPRENLIAFDIQKRKKTFMIIKHALISRLGF